MLVKTVTAVDGAATHYSTPGNMRGRTQLCVHDEWDGTISGTRTWWGSNHEAPSTANDDDWFQITATLTSPAGSAGKEGLDQVTGCKWFREKLVVTSGTGNWTSLVEHVAAATRS